MDIAKRLKECLESKNMTQYALAKSAGVTPAYISQIISGGKTPTIETIEKLCSAMGITLSEFFAGNDVPAVSIDTKASRFDTLHQLVDEVPADRQEEVRRFIEFTIEQHKKREE